MKRVSSHLFCSLDHSEGSLLPCVKEPDDSDEAKKDLNERGSFEAHICSKLSLEMNDFPEHLSVCLI